MKKLLSLPPNLVDCFHTIEKVDPKEWFCTSDPVGARLGSGGGTTWLLEASQQAEAPTLDFEEWLGQEKRILLHAGGQSRRLPAYAPSGKILTPIPVFRWARGQRLSQNLLSLQLPLYEQIMRKAPDSLHTLIASGDVYIKTTEPLQAIPEADIVCYGLWVDSALARNHGVFVSSRKQPEKLDFMLQKPSQEKLSELASSHLFMMDIGVWLLSDRAVSLLRKRSHTADGSQMRNYDLYGEFGLALGEHPTLADEELRELTVAILPLPGGEFYHYGTSRELISSTLAIQNLVRDQRVILQFQQKPHPAIFLQNALLEQSLKADNSEVWIENSFIGSRWTLHKQHLITGVPKNDWTISLPDGVCVDVVPWGETQWVARPYGFNDPFKGALGESSTLFMGRPVAAWAEERSLVLPNFADLQNALLFPVCDSVEQLGLVLRWMTSEPTLSEGKAVWLQASKLSANAISDKANLNRLVAQRDAFRCQDWSLLAKNHELSIFYQLDLADAAQAFADNQIPLPAAISSTQPIMKRIHSHSFRARVMKLRNEPFEAEEQKAFDLLRESTMLSALEDKQSPHLNVYPDQIVWGCSPVRIDLAGGWTDTPPYCLYSGGNVVNIAIDLNGQTPLQVYVKPCKEPKITLRSIDLGAMEVIHTWDELHQYNKVGSPFSIPKAALALAGFSPTYSAQRYTSLESQLKDFGCGLEVTLFAAIPSGSGLGTSSILAATVLGAIADFCGLNWDKNEIGNRTLILEQLLTTGGGWQDQYGGLLHGVKLLHTTPGEEQGPVVRWLPDHLFTDPAYRPCHLLYYTGITRTAKGILAEIVRGMFLNSKPHLQLLGEMKAHALDLFDTIQRNDFEAYGRMVRKTWEQNKALDAGTNPPAIEQIISQIDPYALGYKLPGAGGGGYLYIVAKDPEAAAQIRQVLQLAPPNNCARFVEMSLSNQGLRISRS